MTIQQAATARNSEQVSKERNAFHAGKTLLKSEKRSAGESGETLFWAM